MKILLDTNVLISALIFGGQSGRLLYELFDSSYELIVTDYVDHEFHDKLLQKWPDKAEKVYQLYHTLKIRFLPSTDKKLGKTP